jgi:hypothetical protein
MKGTTGRKGVRDADRKYHCLLNINIHFSTSSTTETVSMAFCIPATFIIIITVEARFI